MVFTDLLSNKFLISSVAFCGLLGFSIGAFANDNSYSSLESSLMDELEYNITNTHNQTPEIEPEIENVVIPEQESQEVYVTQKVITTPPMQEIILPTRPALEKTIAKVEEVQKPNEKVTIENLASLQIPQQKSKTLQPEESYWDYFGIYGGVNVGFNLIPEHNYEIGNYEIDGNDDDGWYFAGILGLENPKTNFKTELEVSHRVNEYTEAGEEITATALTGNLLYVFTNKDRIAGFNVDPYISLGLGGALIKHDVPNYEEETISPVGQAGVGLELGQHGDSFFTLGYKFFAAPETSFKDTAGKEYTNEYLSHNIELGVRF